MRERARAYFKKRNCTIVELKSFSAEVIKADPILHAMMRLLFEERMPRRIVGGFAQSAAAN